MTEKKFSGKEEFNSQIVFRNSFSAYRAEVVSAMREISELADKGPSNLLLALGTVIIIVVIFWKLRPFGIQLSVLTSEEFKTIVAISVILLVIGSLYQYKRQHEINKEIRKAGWDILQQTTEVGKEITGTGTKNDINL
jgi:hypothetical protein